MTVHKFSAKLTNGKEISLADYKGQVLLIVNTASKCGLTPQFEGLENLYKTYKDKGFTILGFPCNQFEGQEPGTDEEISSFCSLNYGVTFPIFKKIKVNGPYTEPVYEYLKEQAPKDTNIDLNDPLYQFLQEDWPEYLEGSTISWNFTKFLVDQDGNVVKRFSPITQADQMKEDIEKLLTK